MTVAFYELHDSRTADGKSVTVEYLAIGEQSTFPIREACIADDSTFPLQNGDFYRNDEKLSIDQVDGLLDHFIVSVTWEAPTQKKEKEKRQKRENGDSHWELSTTSTTIRITHARETEILETALGEFAASNDTIIGEDEATGEIIGAEVPGDATEWKFTFYKPAALVTEAFADDVLALYGKTNDDTFGPFEAGRLLLIDHRFSNDAENFLNVRCDYTFRVERERTVTLEVFGTRTIQPFWHLDIRYERIEEAGPPKRFRKRPKYVKRHRLFDEGDYSILTATEAP